MITSEWGTPNMVKNGVNPELLAGKYGHKIHIWDLDKRRHPQEVDLGAEQQWVLELRPSHDPNKTYGFVSVSVSLKDLSSSIWMWYREDGAVFKRPSFIMEGLMNQKSTKMPQAVRTPPFRVARLYSKLRSTIE